MIKTIAHLADIHLRKTPTRNEEYEKVFDNLYKSLKKQKPDRIVIVGDLVHDYLDLQGEQLILAATFLNTLASIAPVRITRGNHDMRRKNINRVDSIKAIIETINNSNIIYYNKTGFFDDNNITWVVWNHGEQKNNPWIKFKKHQKKENQTYIELYHESINGSKNPNGLENKSNIFINKKEFNGNFVFLGHVHKMQYL